ncbi:MAG TPA: calcineurin, partial [Polyangiaceae bacterium]|nr:calcineurin [Polyangiaceae bacterium]
MHRFLVCSLAGALALQATACGRAQPQEPERQVAEAASAANTVSLSTRLSRPAPERIVAIGDLHGDLDHTRRGLRLAGVVDDHDRWIGGSAVLVQTGDEIDRGDDDRAVLDRIEDLKAQAA